MTSHRLSRLMPAVVLAALAALVALVVALAAPAAAYAQQSTYVVRPGDTLYAIAARNGTTPQAIMSANGLSNPNFIYVGQRLILPGKAAPGAATGSQSAGGVHVVARGQTLSQIAALYGTTVSAIARANGLANVNAIYAGQRLVIPGRGSTAGGSSSAPSGGGGTHVVRAGETLAGIAARYGTTAPALAVANGLANQNLIYVGQRLRVPGNSGSGSGTGSGSSTGGKTGRWIDVDLSSQRVIAYEGGTARKTMTVSTGIARYPTPPGQFRIYAKYPSVTMSGPGYYLRGVPHTMYFYRGYALHGTYWHSNFGHPMSHGCINLSKADAAWLYNWASVGTLVNIHW